MEFFRQLLDIHAMQDYVNAHGWVWPVCEMVHYVGMSLIVGLIGMLDLRILGFCKSLPIGALKPFVPLAIIGFIGNVVSGFVFVAGNPVGGPQAYLENLSFQCKMVVLAIAFINLVIFQVTGLEKAVYATPANADAPGKAKVIAVVSILSWLFIIFFGRLLMYNDTLLLFLGM